MFWPSDIIIDRFSEQLLADYAAFFRHGPAAHQDALVRTARMALSRLSRSDALYHDLDHTITCVMVGQDMLRGRSARDGDVTTEDWVHFVASLLCFAVGFVRGETPGDTPGRCVVDAQGGMIDVPPGVTDGWLWRHYTERSQIFVRHYFRNDPVLDAERMCAILEYSRFPPRPADTETTTYPGMLRAAHLIGAVADPNFQLKMQPLMLELTESGMLSAIGYKTVADFRANYPQFYNNVLRPLIQDGMTLLEYTPQGRMWLSSMHAHLIGGDNRLH